MLPYLDKNNNNSGSSRCGSCRSNSSGPATSGLHLKPARKRINITGSTSNITATRTWSTRKTRNIYHLMLLLMIFLGGSGKLYFMFTDFVNFNFMLLWEVC